MELWEDVVYCFKSLQQEEKAETLIRNLLNKKEHPNYYCILGDITRNAEYYEKAIEVFYLLKNVNIFRFQIIKALVLARLWENCILDERNTKKL